MILRGVVVPLVSAAMLVSFVDRSASAVDIYVLSGTSLGSASTTIPTDFGVIDSTTGVYTSIQTDINAGNTLWGLAYNPTVSGFYAVSNEGGFTGGGLRLLNTAGVLLDPVGSGFSNYSMAYSPAEDAIYGYNYNTDQWYTMNPSTGVRQNTGAGPGVAADPTGGRGTFLNGTYYTTFRNEGRSFGSVDTSTSVFSYTAISLDAAYAFMNLATDGTTLFGVFGDGTSTDLYTINPADGGLTLETAVTGMPAGSYFYGAGVAAVPEPSAVALAVLGMAGGFRSYRRRRAGR